MLPDFFEVDLGGLLTGGSHQRGKGLLTRSLIKSIVIDQFAGSMRAAL
jgi:hypothetical protein